MKKVVAYVRVSTEAQCGEDRFGIDAQKHSIIEYCEKHDMEICEWLIEKGVSGAKDNRPEFNKILNGTISNPPIEAVVVAKNDRVARDVNLYFAYKYQLSKQNIELVSVAEDFGQLGILAPVIEAFTAAMGQVEREMIKVRTSGGRKEKAAQGGYSGGRPPFGYKPSSGTLIIVEEEANIVIDIFKMRDEGMTYEAIANSLNEREIFTRKGNPWKFGTIRTVLDNEQLYRGMYKYGQGDWVKGTHEPILKGETTDEV